MSARSPPGGSYYTMLLSTDDTNILRVLYDGAKRLKDPRLMGALCYKMKRMKQHSGETLNLALVCYSGMIDLATDLIYPQYEKSNDLGREVRRKARAHLFNVSTFMKDACMRLLPIASKSDNESVRGSHEILIESMRRFLYAMRGCANSLPKLDHLEDNVMVQILDHDDEERYIMDEMWADIQPGHATSFPEKNKMGRDHFCFDCAYEYMYYHDNPKKNDHRSKQYWSEENQYYYRYLCSIAVLRSEVTAQESLSAVRLEASINLLNVLNSLVSRIMSSVDWRKLGGQDRVDKSKEVMAMYRKFRQLRCLDTFCFHVMMTLQMDNADYFPDNFPCVFNLSMNPMYERYLRDQNDIQVSRLCTAIFVKSSELYHMLGHIFCCSRDRLFEHFEGLCHIVRLLRDPELLGSRHGRRVAKWFIKAERDEHQSRISANASNPYCKIVRGLSKAVTLSILRPQMPMQLTLTMSILQDEASSRGLHNWDQCVREMKMEGARSSLHRQHSFIVTHGHMRSKRSHFAALTLGSNDLDFNPTTHEPTVAMKKSPGQWAFYSNMIKNPRRIEESPVYPRAFVVKATKRLQTISLCRPTEDTFKMINSAVQNAMTAIVGIPDYLPLTTTHEATLLQATVSLACDVRRALLRNTLIREELEASPSHLKRSCYLTDMLVQTSHHAKRRFEQFAPALDYTIALANTIIARQLKEKESTDDPPDRQVVDLLFDIMIACKTYRSVVEEDGMRFRMSSKDDFFGMRLNNNAAKAQAEMDAFQDCITLTRLGVTKLGIDPWQLESELTNRYRKIVDGGYHFVSDDCPWVVVDNDMYLHVAGQYGATNLRCDTALPPKEWIQQCRHDPLAAARNTCTHPKTDSLFVMELRSRIKSLENEGWRSRLPLFNQCRGKRTDKKASEWTEDFIEEWRMSMQKECRKITKSTQQTHPIPKASLALMGMGENSPTTQQLSQRLREYWSREGRACPPIRPEYLCEFLW